MAGKFEMEQVFINRMGPFLSPKNSVPVLTEGTSQLQSGLGGALFPLAG